MPLQISQYIMSNFWMVDSANTEELIVECLSQRQKDLAGEVDYAYVWVSFCSAKRAMVVAVCRQLRPQR